MLVVKIESCNGPNNCSDPYCTQHPKKKREYNLTDHDVEFMFAGNELWRVVVLNPLRYQIDMVPFYDLKQQHPKKATRITFTDHPEE